MSAALIVSVALAITAALRLSGVGNALDRFLWEARFQADERPLSGDIVIVDIDARSLAELGVWPLPRRLFADLTDKLSGGGARDIVFDVDFSAASSPEDDSLLAAAFERAGNVSLATFLQSATSDAQSGDIVNRPIDELLEQAWPVVVMVPMERDSRIWRNLYGFEIDGMTELSAAAFLGEHTGDAQGSFWLDYSIAIDRLERISLVDVLDGNAPAGVFFDKKVIIGASALELRDLFAVPVYDVLPGSVIQALGAETLLQERALKPRGELFGLCAAFLIFLLLLMTKIDGWAVKISILVLSAVALEVVAFSIQRAAPVLMPTASAHLLLMIAAASIVLRELGFHKILSHLATIRQRNSERMLGLVLEDSFDAIVVVKAGGRISAANQMAKVLFQRDDLVGQTARNALPSEIVEEALAVLAISPVGKPVPKTLAAVQDDGKQRYIEYVVTRSERTVAKSNHSKEVITQAVACLTCRDVTQERQAQERLSYIACYDPVTGLLNRNGFETRLETLLKTTLRRNRDLCVIQLAIINFDQIVASLGHTYGDQLRHAIAVRLTTQIGQKADWSAISANIFAAAFACESEEDLVMVEAIKQVLGEDFNIEGARISVQLKFGYVVSEGSVNPETLLKKSGNALAKVRRDSKSQALAFRPELEDRLQRRRRLETELFKAIVRDEVHMVYQPLVNLNDNSVYGVEALLRWDHRELGSISPAEFVPIAEENGYIVELGAWALNRAMKETLSWPGSLRLSVNISAVQFSRGNLVATVKEALERTGFPAERLDLEITESLFIDDTLDLDFIMEELRAIGCSFSLDDFGTGYSSLGYIPKFPFSKIKLDKSFVRQSISSKKDSSVIEAVLHLANGYDMTVVVEGIETVEQAERLRELGCQHGQGYLYGRPTSASGLTRLLLRAA